jgi:micrococcal nuclease
MRRVLGALLIVVALAGCTPVSPTEAGSPAGSPGGPATPATSAARALPVPAGAQQAVVVRHTDGDTFWLRGLGAGPVPGVRTKVRLLEVDTPEVFGTAGCFGPQASARTAALLPLGSTVRVEADRGLRDRYGRLLLYVWVPDGASLEEELLRGGYARVLLVRPNARHIAVLRAVEAQARAARRGLWGACHP